MTNLSPQSIVRFTGSSDEQDRWGSCNDSSILEVGKYYKVTNVEVHSWHTKIELQGVEGKFNQYKLVDTKDYENNVRTLDKVSTHLLIFHIC